MNREQLSIFCLAAETLNFSEVARRTYQSQPAISQSIKALERFLGVPLFERKGRGGLQLTEAGAVFYRDAQRLCQDMDNLVTAMRNLKGEVAGCLTLGASLTNGNYALPPILSAFQRLYPKVHFELILDNSSHLLEQFRQRRLHLLFLEGPRPEFPDREGLVQTFHEDELAIIKGTQWKLPGLSLHNLQEHRWIFREAGSGTRQIFIEQLALHGIAETSLQVDMELNSTEAIKQVLMTSETFACISPLTIQKEKEMGLLEIVPLDALSLKRSLWRVSPEGTTLPYHYQVFLNYLDTLNLSPG